jgi:hypothetical protein
LKQYRRDASLRLKSSRWQVMPKFNLSTQSRVLRVSCKISLKLRVEIILLSNKFIDYLRVWVECVRKVSSACLKTPVNP